MKQISSQYLMRGGDISDKFDKIDSVYLPKFHFKLVKNNDI